MIKLINPAYERLPLFEGAAYAFGRARIENEIAQTTLKGPLRAIDHAKVLPVAASLEIWVLSKRTREGTVFTMTMAHLQEA